MYSGESLQFSGFTLVMQGDGNLVLYQDGQGGGAKWATGTNGKCTRCLAAFQGDGNLVIYETDLKGSPLKDVFSSRTGGTPGARFFFYSAHPYFAIMNESGKAVYWGGSESTSGWAAKIFRPESLSKSIPKDDGEVAAKMQEAFSPPYEWAVAGNSLSNPNAFEDKEILPTSDLNALALMPNSNYTENPFRSDESGSSVDNGPYLTYKAFIISQNDPQKSGNYRLGLTDLTIVVKNPYSESASIHRMMTNRRFYDLYLEMSEGLNQGGDYDLGVTPDVSGKFFVPNLNSGVKYAEEHFSDCTNRICPQNDFQNPSVPLFSGKAIYFKGDGLITINNPSVTGFELLKDAEDLTISLAVRPIKNLNNGAESSNDYRYLIDKTNSFNIILEETRQIQTSIFLRNPTTL
ncbi:MAG: hypothetical protein IPL83_03905 [Bdellovibrionales bacterium]|nr:hypothetical protein [Bdellovibrionales bacterium]